VQQLLPRPFAQGKDDGARPLVRAVGAPDVRSGEYWGPDGFLQLTGRPALVRPRPHALERNAASRLIDLSRDLTGSRLPL
jgi:hypothetical protein